MTGEDSELSVLVVDDDEELCRTAVSSLTELGIQAE